MMKGDGVGRPANAQNPKNQPESSPRSVVSETAQSRETRGDLNGGFGRPGNSQNPMNRLESSSDSVGSQAPHHHECEAT
jgi:hypothetical protein